MKTQRITIVILATLFLFILSSFNVSAVAPTVTTNAATGIEETNATLRGTLTADGGLNCSVGFNYGTTTSYGTNVNNSYIIYPNSIGQILLSDSENYRPTKHGIKVESFSGTPLSSTFYLKRSGAPTGSVYGRIRYVSNDTIYDWDSFDITTLPSASFQYKTFTFTKGPVTGDFYITVEYAGGGYYNYLIVSTDSVAGKGWTFDEELLVWGVNSIPPTINFTNLIETGDTFSYNAIGLTPGTLYHYRAFANNTDGTGVGADSIFLTKPLPQTSVTTTYTPHTSSFYFSWTKGTGANNTVIVRKTRTYPTTPTDGAVVYNNTGVFYNDTALVAGTVYCYTIWSWTAWTVTGVGTYHQFSDTTTQAIQLTKPTAATTLSSTKVGHNLNITWTLGTGRNSSVLVKSATHYPTKISDGSILYNGTHACYLDTTIGHVNGSKGYYRVFSYTQYVITGTGTLTQTSEGNYSRKFIYSNQTVYPNVPTSIEETTTTISATYYGDTISTCGFWLGYSDPLSQATAALNVTSTGTFSLNNTFTYSLTTLISAKYYYVKAWFRNTTIFGNATTEQYFLTKPNAPSSPVLRHIGNTNVLSWTNASIPASTPNNRTIVRYQSSGPPTSVTDGYGVNVSSNHTIITAGAGTYYFSLFHYIKDSGSPTFHWYSDTYVWTMGTIEGGTYNITIRYENTTYGAVNLSRGNNHTFIVQYSNRTEYNYFRGKIWAYTETTFWKSNPFKGTFSINLTQTPIWFEFHWNDTTVGSTSVQITEKFYDYPPAQNETTTFIQLLHPPSSYSSINVSCWDSVTHTRSFPNFLLNENTITINPYQAGRFNQVNITYSYNTQFPKYRCNRIIVPIPGGAGFNRSIYILTNKEVYGETATVFDNSIIRYIYSFQDKSGAFESKPELDSYAFIYTYDMLGNKIVIHEEFFDSTDQIYPWLLYGKQYFIGVACSAAVIDRIGIAPTSSDTNPQVIIPHLTEQIYNLHDIVMISYAWNDPAPGFWLQYLDTVFKTNNVTLRVYNLSDGSLVYTHGSSSFSTNFSCPFGNPHQTYTWVLIINHSYWTTNQTASGILFPYMYPSHNASWANAILNMTLGTTPFRNPDTGQEIPWIYVVIGGIAFLILLSFATINAPAGVAGAGLWFILAGTFFNHLPEVGLLGSAALIIGGCFMLILAIIAALGGFGR